VAGARDPTSLRAVRTKATSRERLRIELATWNRHECSIRDHVNEAEMLPVPTLHVESFVVHSSQAVVHFLAESAIETYTTLSDRR